MAGDEFAMILAASDFVGWYKCPNGHPYSVGNCTKPMQLARCPACNAPIGGQNHNDVSGVTRLGDTRDMREAKKDRSNTRKGYNRDDLNMGANGLNADMVVRAGEAATRVLRIFMHLLLHLHGSGGSRWQPLYDVLKPPDKRGTAGEDGSKASQAERSVRAFLEDQILSDWAGLQEMFGLDEEQVAAAI